MSRISLLNKQWSAGALLVICVIVAMFLANLSFTKDIYQAFLNTKLSIVIQSPLDLANGERVIDWLFPKDMTIDKFINDVLMVVFFFVVGLDIKHQVLFGELSTLKKAILPVIAAIGGMVFPALIYFAINRETLSVSGWGIPTATDIAFAIGILSIVGSKVPISLKVFLTALAVADDLGAILVVAIFYGGELNFTLITIAIFVLISTWFLNRLGEKRVISYLIPAIIVWFLFYYAGIHATMAGVIMAMIIPVGNTKEGDGMSYRLERALTPWVNFIIMPLFALANAGVEVEHVNDLNIFDYSTSIGSVGMGVYFGLLLGKPIGITFASWLAIKLRIAEMPQMASWRMFFAVACLGGIGFTMSIFIDSLSFQNLSQELQYHLSAIGKISVFAASVSAALLGSVLINTIK